MGSSNMPGRWRKAHRRRQAQKRLDTIQVAKPCPAHWEEMAGDEKVRFCAQCRLHVFNLSAMDLDEAANLIAEKDGRLCVRFYRRRDGTTLTQDCPVGVAEWRRRLMVGWSAVAGAFAAVLYPAARSTFAGQTMGDIAPARAAEVPVNTAQPVMGSPAPAPMTHTVGMLVSRPHIVEITGKLRTDSAKLER